MWTQLQLPSCPLGHPVLSTTFLSHLMYILLYHLLRSLHCSHLISPLCNLNFCSLLGQTANLTLWNFGYCPSLLQQPVSFASSLVVFFVYCSKHPIKNSTHDFFLNWLSPIKMCSMWSYCVCTLISCHEMNAEAWIRQFIIIHYCIPLMWSC